MPGPAATSDVAALRRMYADLDGRDETIAQKDADITRLSAIIAQKDALLAELGIRRAALERGDACHNGARPPSSTRPGGGAERRKEEAEEQGARNPNRRRPPDRPWDPSAPRERSPWTGSRSGRAPPPPGKAYIRPARVRA